MHALFMLIVIGNASIGWTQTVTNVGEYKDKGSCENAARNAAFLPPDNLPGGVPPRFICIPRQP